MAPKDDELKFIPIPLNGKWIPAADGTELGQGDFQVLTNMRYGKIAPKSIAGMTKINTAALGAIQNGMQFKKDQPSESHIMVQAVNGGGGTSVYENMTAIPNQGNFGASVWDDSSGAGLGRFSPAPDGCMIYCNGVDTLVHGGNESRCGAFLCGDSLANVIYADYTTAVNNTLTDVSDVALPAVGGSNPYYVYIGSTRPISGAKFYVLNPNASAASVGVKYWASGAWVSVSGLSDGTKSGGVGPTLSASGIISFNSTVAVASPVLINQIYAYFYQFKFTGIASTTSLSQVTLVAPIQPVVDLWDGMQRPIASFLSTQGGSPPQYSDYTPNVYRSEDYVAGNSATFWNGSNFNGNGTSYLLVGFSERMTAFYVQFGGTRFNRAGASLCTVSYWNGHAWTAVTGLKDGTILNGLEFAQNGLISWDAPELGTEFPQSIGVNAPSFYYYKVVFNNTDGIGTLNGGSGGTGYATGDTFTINGGSVLATGSIAAQTGGVPSQFVLTSTGQGYSVANNVATTHTSGSGTGLTVNISSLTTSLYSSFLPGTGTISVVANYSAINGVGTSFTTQLSVGDTISPPLPAGKPHAVAAIISDTLAYISDIWDATYTSVPYFINSSVAVDYIYGVPTQAQIRPYKFPLYWQNRLVLCNDQSQNRNEILLSSSETVNVFNGTDSETLRFGDNTDIVAGASLFARFGGSIYENLILCKNNETWLVDGTSVASYVTYKVSDAYGCAAPMSLAVCSMGYGLDGALNKHVAIWLSANGIVMFDLNSVNRIDSDISNYFDVTQPECINSTLIGQSVGWFDEQYSEYHITIPSGSGAADLNTELAYDLVGKKWFKVNRGDGNIIRCAFPVIDTSGNKYLYGGINGGYIERLENGQTFDGVPITSEFATPDIPLAGMGVVSEVRSFKLMARSKNNTPNSATVTHYADASNTASDTLSLSLADTARRVVQKKQTVNWQNGVFHAIDCAISTSNEPCGFEPVALGVFVKTIRDDLK
jgi:hypothetical protein